MRKVKTTPTTGHPMGASIPFTPIARLARLDAHSIPWYWSHSTSCKIVNQFPINDILEWFLCYMCLIPQKMNKDYIATHKAQVMWDPLMKLNSQGS